MEYQPVIGLEVHAQLSTKSKIFCSCSTAFGAMPNTNICPICIGMPGVLPVLNKEVVASTIKTALATNCNIQPMSRFARKNYFYPDLPKGYQISQYELPIAKDGHIEIVIDDKKKQIGINRIHIEEDAGKLIHGENLGSPTSSYVDLNRSSVPLIEIVSEPHINSPEEARIYLLKLKAILEYLEVCDCNMEEGSLRCDANVSIRPKGSNALGTKTELKNMNSFRNVQRALEYEIKRQTMLIENGERVIQETRLWDAKADKTISMRGKEEAHDYRYFPEPDLVPLVVNKEWINEIKIEIPELPDKKQERFVIEYAIPVYDAEVLTSSKRLADYFEETVKIHPNAKAVSNWIMVEILRELKDDDRGIEDCPVTPIHLALMLQLIDNNVISGKIAKTVFEEMYKTGAMPKEIIEKRGLVQITDQDEVLNIINKVLADNPKEVQLYKNGKENLFGFFIGQIMKLSKGKINPKIANELLKKALS